MSRRPPLDQHIMEALALAEPPSTHPDDGLLIEYQAGRLAPQDAEEVASHLATCPECSRFVLAAQAFSAEGDALPPVEADEMAADWRSLSRRLAMQGGPDEARSETPASRAPGSSSSRVAGSGTPPPESRPSERQPSERRRSERRRSERRRSERRRSERRRRPGWLSSPALGYGLAVSLLCAIFGLQWTHGRDAARLAELESWNAAAGELASDFALLTLSPQGATRDAAGVTEVQGGDVLLLALPQEYGGEALVLEMVRSEGVVHRVTDLRGLEEGAAQLKLPSAGLAAGPYELVLRRVDSGEVVATYRIRVEMLS